MSGRCTSYIKISIYLYNDIININYYHDIVVIVIIIIIIILSIENSVLWHKCSVFLRLFEVLVSRDLGIYNCYFLPPLMR